MEELSSILQHVYDSYLMMLWHVRPSCGYGRWYWFKDGGSLGKWNDNKGLPFAGSTASSSSVVSSAVPGSKSVGSAFS